MGCFKEINLSSRLQKHKQTQTTDLWKLPASRLPGCCWGPPGGEGGCSRTELAQRYFPETWGVCPPAPGHPSSHQLLAIPPLKSLQDPHSCSPAIILLSWVAQPQDLPSPHPSATAAGMASEDIHWPSHWPFSVAPPLHLFRVPSFWPLLFFLHLPPLGEGSYLL